MALKPPRHRVDDANPVFISSHDIEAWLPRLEAELEECQSSDELDDADHPHRVYSRGATRYDLAAPIRWKGEDLTILDYVDEAKATKFLLARLPPDVRVGMRRKIGQNYEAACLECVRWGLKGIVNGPGYKRNREGCVTDGTIQEIIMAGGDELIEDIGTAIFLYNMGLSDAEKKA